MAELGLVIITDRVCLRLLMQNMQDDVTACHVLCCKQSVQLEELSSPWVHLQIRVVRIFNTYGPRMALDDGRVVSNFVAQALTDQPLTVYGDGKQTRSFQYVSDLIKGKLMWQKAGVRSCLCLREGTYQQVSLVVPVGFNRPSANAITATQVASILS